MRQSIAIIGTGDYGRALGKRLLANDYDVVFGSRQPNKRNLSKIDGCLGQARVDTIEASVRSSQVVFLAIPGEVYPKMKAFQSLLAGKVVVDVSNGERKPKKESNAERLAAVLPDSKIVKAFNTVSAYSMESDAAGDRRLVYICGEDAGSRDVVRQIAQGMRFVPIDCGGLLYARQLETLPHELMAGWLAPTIVSLIILAFWIIYGTLRYYYLRDDPYGWERFPVNTLNKIMGCTAMTILPLAFLPGCIAGFAHLINGTKYKRFPVWLDGWLKMRKHLGYYALFLTAIHVLMSVTIMNPAYFSRWFHFSSQVVPLNRTDDTDVTISSRMTWLGETATLLGLLATFGMAIMGIVSLPSVAALLNWVEWRFFQSYLGWLTLLLATSHTTLLGAAGSWKGEAFVDVIQKMTFVGSLTAWLTLLLKIILMMPGISCYLTNIRKGYERGQSSEDTTLVDVTSSGGLSLDDITDAGKVPPNEHTDPSWTSQPISMSNGDILMNGKAHNDEIEDGEVNLTFSF